MVDILSKIINNIKKINLVFLVVYFSQFILSIHLIAPFFSYDLLFTLPSIQHPTILIIALFITLILTYVTLVHHGGLSYFFLKSLKQGGCLTYPKENFLRTLYFRTSLTPLAILLISIIGSVIGILYGSVPISLVWNLYCLFLFYIFFSSYPYTMRIVNSLLSYSSKIDKLNTEPVIYADRDLILKNRLLIQRTKKGNRVCLLDKITSYGYVSNKQIFIKCGIMSIMISCNDAKTAFKTLQKQFEEKEINIPQVTTSEIEEFMRAQKLLNYLYLGIAASSIIFLITLIVLGIISIYIPIF